MELEFFFPLVLSLSQKSRIFGYEQKDIEQELYVKLIEIFPRLEKLPEDQAKKLAARCLKSRIIDLYNKVKFGDAKEHFFEENEIENLIGEGIETIIPYLEGSIQFEQLKCLIFEWSEKQSETVQTFIREWFDPSPIIKQIYRNRCFSNKQAAYNYDDTEIIPPFTLLRILNIPERQWMKARKLLQKHLKQHGY